MTHPLHFVQFAGSDEELLTYNVGEYLLEGLKRKQRCVVIATPQHTCAFVDHLKSNGIDGDAQGDLVLLDATEVARALLQDDVPCANQFDHIVGPYIRSAVGRKSRGVRAYGEIVGVYWSEGRRDASVQVEHMWNELMREIDFPLYCGYPIGPIDHAFTIDAVDDLMCAHGEVVSGLDQHIAEQAISSALQAVLGDHASVVREYMRGPDRPRWSTLPKAEAMVLWLRKNVQKYAGEIVSRAASEYNLKAARGALAQ